MLDAKDVKDLRVPFGFYPSKVCELYVSAAAYSNISRAYVYIPLTERA
jgi:hypothetical protein